MFTDPAKNLKAFGLRDNMVVADLGAGTGFYSILAAQMVPQGKVYAIEVVKDFLQTIVNKAKESNLQNVECLCADIEKVGGTKIADGVVNAVIASNILFQVEDKETFINEIKRILSPGGRVLLVDWVGEAGAPVSKGSAIPKSVALDLFEKKGFVLEREIDAGVHHYGMILKK